MKQTVQHKKISKHFGGEDGKGQMGTYPSLAVSCER